MQSHLLGARRSALVTPANAQIQLGALLALRLRPLHSNVRRYDEAGGLVLEQVPFGTELDLLALDACDR